jgi:hypothetical protein
LAVCTKRAGDPKPNGNQFQNKNVF